MMAASFYLVGLGDYRNDLVFGIEKCFQGRHRKIRGTEKDDPQGLIPGLPSIKRMTLI